MKQTSELTRKLLLAGAAIACIILVFLFTFSFTTKETIPSSSYDESPSGENILQEELFVSTTYPALSIKPDYIQKQSIRVIVDEAYLQETNPGEYDLYFTLMGQDMLTDEGVSKSTGNYFFRSPLSWNAQLVLYVKEREPLLICDTAVDGRFWNTTYCISTEMLDKSYFGQTTRLIYTDETVGDSEEKSLLALAKQDRTFVFDLILPELPAE